MSRGTVIQLAQLADNIQHMLELYSERVIAGTNEAARTAVEEMVQTTKQRPTKDKRATGKYARAHASRQGDNTKFRNTWIWYVEPNQHVLAHLLNKGHRTRSGGRVPGDKHITDATNKAMARFEELVKEVINRESN